MQKARPLAPSLCLPWGPQQGLWESLSCKAIAEILKTRNDYLGEGDKKEKNGRRSIRQRLCKGVEVREVVPSPCRQFSKATEVKARREMASHRSKYRAGI